MFSIKCLQVVSLATILGFYRYTQCAQFNSTPTKFSPSLQLSADRQSKDNSVIPDGKFDSQSSFSISPSFSYQFHTNDHEHLDPIVLGHRDSSFRNSNNAPSDTIASASTSVGTVSSQGDSTAPVIPSSPSLRYPASISTYEGQQQRSDAQRNRNGEGMQQQFLPQQYPSAPQAFLQEQYLSQKVQVGDTQSKNATSLARPRQSKRQRRILQQNIQPTWNPMVKNEQIRNYSTSFVYSRPLQSQNGSPISNSQRQQQQQYTSGSYSGFKAATVPLASRGGGNIDGRKAVEARADDEEADHMEYYEHDPKETNEVQDHDHDHEYYSQSNNADDVLKETPEVRDFGPPPHPPPFGPEFFAESGGPFGGPLPPPPPPLKGSIDYILIPLILIGISGPIFVVLYVILGGFEARLSPIQRSLNDYSEYKPYIDTITSNVGRALEKYECFDYAACRASSFCNRLGFSGSTSTTVESAVTSVTPKEYLPTVRSLFSVLKHPEQKCEKYACSAMMDDIARKF